MISDAYVRVYCDTPGCDYSDEFKLDTTTRGYDERSLQSDMRSAGWVEISDNVHQCPQCAEDDDEEQEQKEQTE